MATDADEILAMEKAAMKRWAKGDPDGFLEIYDESVVYFDPFVEYRMNGLTEMRTYYEKLRGKVHLDDFEFVDPRVVSDGKLAVVTYNFVSHTGKSVSRWNTTDVLQRKAGGWRIVQSHWSLTQPKLAAE